MPTVEWAQTPTVSRPAPLLRDRPEESGDLFAALFDSARRSIGERVERTVREQQRTDAGRSAGPATAERPSTDDRTKANRSGRVEETGESPHATRPHASTEEAGFAEANRPSSSEAGTEPHPRAESDDADDPKRPKGQDQSADAGESSQTTPPADSRQPGELVGESDHHLQTASADDAVRMVEQMNETPEPSQMRRLLLPEVMAGQSEPAAGATAPASTDGLTMKMLSASGQPAMGEAGATAAPVTTTAPGSGDSVPTGNAARSQPAAANRSLADMPPLRIWSAFTELILNSEKGLEVRLAEVMASVVGKPASPSAATPEQEAAGSIAGGRPAAGQAATAVLSAALEGQKGFSEHQGEMSNQDRSLGGDGARGSSAEGGRAAATGIQQNGVPDELRGLLEAAGRVRERIASPDAQPEAGFTGRGLAGKGVNLSEARAMNGLAEVVRANSLGRNSSILLRLDPPELGQLRIDVRMQGQELTLRLQVDTLAGHDALRSRLQELRSSLEQHGFKLNQVEVELRVPQPSTAEPHQDRSTQQQAQWDGQTGRGPGWQEQAQGGGDTPAESRFLQDNSAFSGENASIGEEHDEAGRPAETGVDLVV